MKLTKSHPVSRALRAGLSMKAAWAAFRGGKTARKSAGKRRARRTSRRRNKTGIPFSGKKAYRPRFKRISKGRHPMAFALNKPRRKSRRRSGSRRRRNMLHNPLYAFNRARRSRAGRRARRASGRRRRNPVTFFNPFRLLSGGGFVGKALAKVKELASVGGLTKAAAGTVGAILAIVIPSRFFPQFDSGWARAGVQAAASIVASLIVGMVAPAYAAAILAGGLVMAGVTAAYHVAGPQIQQLAQPKLAGFLTIGPSNLPAGQVAGMGAFLETRQPIASMGPASSGMYAPVGRYTNAS